MWTGRTDTREVPTPHQIRQWEGEFDVADRLLFVDVVEKLPVLHLAVDASSKKDHRYVLLASYWDTDSSKPKRMLLSAFVLVRETAADFEKDIKTVLALHSIRSLIDDLSGTNVGAIQGISTQL